MDTHVESVLHKLRYTVVPLLLIGNLWLVLLLLSTVGSSRWATNAHAQSANTRQSMSSNAADDPNIISGGASELLGKLGQAVGSAGTVSSDVTGAVARTAANGARFTTHGATLAARGVYKCLAVTAYGMFRGIGFVVRLPLTAIGFVADKTIVSSVIRPDNNAQAPIISPLSTATLAASMPLPTARAASQAVVPSSDVIWPIHGQITTYFGASDWPYQLVHTGIDISDGRASGVTPIHAFKAGRVIDVIHSGSGLGNHVIIDHGNGLTSVYAHLYSIAAVIGEPVTTESVIGLEGSTGASTGTHLHFEIRISGQPVNPQSYISSPL